MPEKPRGLKRATEIEFLWQELTREVGGSWAGLHSTGRCWVSRAWNHLWRTGEDTGFQAASEGHPSLASPAFTSENSARSPNNSTASPPPQDVPSLQNYWTYITHHSTCKYQLCRTSKAQLLFKTLPPGFKWNHLKYWDIYKILI